MSYSQNSEEEHILRILDVDNIHEMPRFLDIGSYHPKLFSNTRALFERGWAGVMVEPSPGPFLDLLIEYGNCDRIQLVCAAVAAQPGLLKFHHSEAGIGTSDETHYQKWRDKGLFDGTFYAASIDLFTLIQTFGSEFDFINIDVEGNSADLFLEAINNLGFRPKCWCVEHDGRQAEMSDYADLRGYCVRHINGENIIFERVE